MAFDLGLQRFTNAERGKTRNYTITRARNHLKRKYFPYQMSNIYIAESFEVLLN